MDIKSTMEIHLFSLTLMERKNFMRRLFKPGVVKVEKNTKSGWAFKKEQCVLSRGVYCQSYCMYYVILLCVYLHVFDKDLRIK